MKMTNSLAGILFTVGISRKFVQMCMLIQWNQFNRKIGLSAVANPNTNAAKTV